MYRKQCPRAYKCTWMRFSMSMKAAVKMRDVIVSSLDEFHANLVYGAITSMSFCRRETHFAPWNMDSAVHVLSDTNAVQPPL